MTKNDIKYNIIKRSQYEITNKIDNQDDKIKLYPKYNAYLEANSVTYIPLSSRQKAVIKANKNKDFH